LKTVLKADAFSEKPMIMALSVKRPPPIKLFDIPSRNQQG
jgi:hypothetical protein